jgi:lipopolysaccharide transport system permease protein
MLRDLWRHRDLAMSLVRRQFQVRYRQSALGFVWAVIPPLVTVVAATLVFHGVVNVDTGKIPYPIFAFSALVPWTFFASSLNGGVASVVQSQQMVSRIPFPRAALPLSMVGLAFVDLTVASVTFIAFSYATGNPLPATAVWFPLLLAIDVVFTAGLTILLSAVNVFARDVKLMLPFLLQVWLLLTPVMYPLSSVPERLRPLYIANPMTGLVESFRRILVSPGEPPTIELLTPAIIGAMFAALLGVWYFAATESRFADVI